MPAPEPAWKRLGLKLKHSNEQVPGLARKQIDRASEELNAQTTASEPAKRPAKRQKLNGKDNSVHSVDSVGQSSVRDASLKKSSSRQGFDSQAVANEVACQEKQKKSVAFTNETKTEDGDSRITIDFPAGLPQGQTTKSRSDSAPIRSSAEASKEAPSGKTKKKSKIRKKVKHQQEVKDKAAPSLEYLSQHRQHRSMWKFNKNRDIWILNHALDTEKIPSTHVLALSGYLRGLPSHAGSRARLVQQCKDTLPEARLEADSSDEARDKFISLIESPGSEDQDGVAFLEAHSRPAILLWALGESAESGSTGGPAQLQGQRKQSDRKRKLRVRAEVEISSSESDSDSDSDGSSDSEVMVSAKSNGTVAVGDALSSDTSSNEDSSDSSTSSDSEDSSD